MKYIFKNMLFILTLFSFSNTFADVETTHTLEIEKEIFSEEDKTTLSLGWGHLTAQMFKETSPLAIYYNLQEYLHGINSYLEGETCEASSEECQKEFLEIIGLLQNQTPCNEEATEEKVTSRSFSFGWHTASQINTDFRKYISLEYCIKGLNDEIEGVPSPLTLQETIALIQKHLLPITTQKDLKKNNEEMEIMIGSDSLVIIDFSSTSCPPCRQLKPVLEELKGEGNTIYFLDSLKYGSYMSKYKIISIPTVWIFKDGEKVEEFIGFKSKEDILEILNKYK